MDQRGRTAGERKQRGRLLGGECWRCGYSQQTAGRGLDANPGTARGHGGEDFAIKIGDGSARVVGERPLGQPLEAEFAVEAVEIGDTGQEAVGMLANVVAALAAAEFDDRGGQRGVGGGVGPLAGELAKRSVDDGDGLGRRIQGDKGKKGAVGR